MAFIFERHQSRNFDLGGKTISLTRQWCVTDAADETVALNMTLLASPILFDGLIREGIKADNQGGLNWYVDVRYANIDPQHALPNDAGAGGGGTQAGANGPTDADPLTDAWTFDTTGATTHITQSLGTRFKVTDAATTNEAAASLAGFTLDNERAIGVSGDRVEGCDIVVPRLEFSREVVRSEVKLPYLRTLRDLTGTMNAETFYGFDPYELLFLGSSGRYGAGRWNVTYRFGVSKHESNVVIGNLQTITSKAGWDYLWVHYRAGATSSDVLQRPTAAYVERVYEAADFALLEIGV